MESNKNEHDDDRIRSTIAKIHFEPTLTLGHLASALIFILGGLTAWWSLKEDVATTKAAQAIRWENQERTLQDIQLKNKEQDIAIRELGVELKSELRANSQEIKQEFRDLKIEIRKK